MFDRVEAIKKENNMVNIQQLMAMQIKSNIKVVNNNPMTWKQSMITLKIILIF